MVDSSLNHPGRQEFQTPNQMIKKIRLLLSKNANSRLLSAYSVHTAASLEQGRGCLCFWHFYRALRSISSSASPGSAKAPMSA